MSEISVRELSSAEIPAASAVLGRSLRDNPLLVRLAGADPARREKALGGIFGETLAVLQAKGTLLGAFQGDRLAGLCGLVPPGRCQTTGREKLRILKAVVTHLSLGASLNASRWIDGWARHDPADQPHWHLGPLAVEPEQQRHGLGRALLEAACARVDANGDIAYLEADREELQEYFERFLFRTIGQEEIVGVPNWFMLRPARNDTARWARPPTQHPGFVLSRPPPRPGNGPKPG